MHFESDEGENNAICPNCGCYDIYPDTAEGVTRSVKDMTDYENTQELWED
jgi:hypothetical protein